MKKAMIVLLVISVAYIFAQPLSQKVIVGYWHNWQYSPNTIFLNEISDDFDVINISFAIPTEPFGSSMQFTPDPGIYPNVQDFIDDIGVLQENGKNVFISIGGANDPVDLETENDINNFVSSMTTIINTYGFDGLDIDLEGGSVSLDPGDNDFQQPTTPKIVNLIEAITRITDDLPDLKLTTAPETAYVQGGYSTYGGIWGAYLPIIHALRDRWDMVHVQHYNTGLMYGADGNLYNPATADFHVAMADMLLGGFIVDHWVSSIFFEPLSPEQVAIGLPASPSAAGTGYTAPEVVHDALDYIILGESYGGSYQLSEPEGYENFRGLMTWSVNWDQDYNFEFSASHRAYLDSLNGSEITPPNDVAVDTHGYINYIPSNNDPCETFNIYLNNVLLINTSNTSYLFRDIMEGQSYTAGVSAIVEGIESDISAFDFTAEYSHVYGDIDDDDEITAYDASIVLRYSVGIDPGASAPLPWENWRIFCSDVNADQITDAYDAALILQYVVGIINTFPGDN